MKISKTNQNRIYSRSRSANVYHNTHHKQFRVDSNEAFNNLRNDIKNTFSIHNKHFQDVKQLTSKVSPAHSEKINKICVKYSICPNPKRIKRCSQDIDVQFIAKSYVRSKSRDKKKEEMKNQLKQSIKLISRRYQQPKQKEFFKLQCQNLRQLNEHDHTQKRHYENHPYLKIYEKSQAEVLSNILHQNKISINTISDCPNVNEPDEWEKDQKQIKQMYTTIKNLRAQANKYRQRKRDKDDSGSFYLT